MKNAEFISFTAFMIMIVITLSASKIVATSWNKHILKNETTFKNSENVCVQGSLVQLASIIRTMAWSNVVILYEPGYEYLVLDIIQKMETEQEHKIPKITMYYKDYTDGQKIRDFLCKSYKTDTSSVTFILFLNSHLTQFLEIADLYDFESNKTTNYQTNSYWVIWNDVSLVNKFYYIPVNLKNLILLDCGGNSLNSLTLSGNTMQKITCNGKGLVHWTCSITDLYPNLKYKLNGRHLRIGTLESLMMKKNVVENGSSSTSIYTGFLKDLTDILSHSLNFTYTYVEPEDGNYGGKKNGKWLGLIGLLERQEVDMVIADLTVTEDRLEAVDYISPRFAQNGIDILYKNGVKTESNWIKIFKPLHLYVYICTFVSLFAVGLVLLSLGFEDSGRRKKKKVDGKLLRLLHLSIALIGFVAIRGDGIWPRRDSARVIVVSFWMLCLVIAGVYVGNLAAKLTDTGTKPPFTSVKELVKLSDWKWGMADGFTRSIISRSEKGLLSDLWKNALQFNQTDPTVLGPKSSVHVHKVLSSEKYAFFTSSALQSHVFVRKDCLLEAVEGVVGGMSLAIAVTKQSYLTADLERIMWKIFDNGFLKTLEDRHHKDNRPPCCKIKETPRPMNLEDMSGSVFVIGVGLTLTLIVLIMEIIKVKRNRTVVDEETAVAHSSRDSRFASSVGQESSSVVQNRENGKGQCLVVRISRKTEAMCTFCM